MNLVKPQPKPFIDAETVAKMIGGISAKTVSNRQGITKDLTRYTLATKVVDGVRVPAKYGYCPDEVAELVQQIREQAEREKQARDAAGKKTDRLMRSSTRRLQIAR